MANTISSSLLKAYERSSYCVFTGERELIIYVNKPSAALDQLLTAHNVTSAAFITAWNPASVRLSAAANANRNAAFITDVENAGFSYLPGEGRDPAGEWPAESSFLLLGIPMDEATAIAQRYGQNAYLYFSIGGVAELIIN